MGKRLAMLNKLRALFAPALASAPVVTAIPAGERVYAIGDIHGRADLFEMIIAQIEADDAARGPAQTTVILLGDLVDRGPDSAGVIARARDWAARRPVRMLQGNHEEMFLKAFDDDVTLRHFLRFGGRETLLSYPITPDEYQRTTIEELQVLMRERVPAADIAFMAAMENLIRVGDYVFVHAGIRPGVALDAQKTGDLRWIRAEFLDDATPRDFAVVHGHTITPAPELHPWRIGIDTGAFASGQLTAVGLEGTERWLVTAQGETMDFGLDASR
jgi:serine/threonine protein phosphatase 1